MTRMPLAPPLLFFFFNDTATTEIYTLSLHDALPISAWWQTTSGRSSAKMPSSAASRMSTRYTRRSEEHTSELQSPDHLVCRLLLEKKKTRATAPRCSRGSPPRQATQYYKSPQPPPVR